MLQQTLASEELGKPHYFPVNGWSCMHVCDRPLLMEDHIQ